MDEIKYQVGSVNWPTADDQTFDDYDEAVDAAIASSYDDAVWVIRAMPEGNVEALVYQQRTYQ